MAPVSQKLAGIPSVAAAITAAGPQTAVKNAKINYEALLQSWHATPAELTQIGHGLLDEAYARCVIVSLEAGAKAGVALDNARVDAIVAKAEKLLPSNGPLRLDIGALYYYQHRDDLAEKAVNTLDQITTDPDLQSTRLEWLANIRLRANDRQGALDCLQLSVQLAPKSADHLYFYAIELDKAGDAAKAIEIYHRFLGVEATSNRSQKVKNRLAELQQAPEPAAPAVSPPGGTGL